MRVLKKAAKNKHLQVYLSVWMPIKWSNILHKIWKIENTVRGMHWLTTIIQPLFLYQCKIKMMNRYFKVVCRKKSMLSWMVETSVPKNEYVFNSKLLLFLYCWVHLCLRLKYKSWIKFLLCWSGCWCWYPTLNSRCSDQ